jgi:hypothetical protein
MSSEQLNAALAFPAVHPDAARSFLAHLVEGPSDSLELAFGELRAARRGSIRNAFLAYAHCINIAELIPIIRMMGQMPPYFFWSTDPGRTAPLLFLEALLNCFGRSEAGPTDVELTGFSEFLEQINIGNIGLTRIKVEALRFHCVFRAYYDSYHENRLISIACYQSIRQKIDRLEGLTPEDREAFFVKREAAYTGPKAGDPYHPIATSTSALALPATPDPRFASAPDLPFPEWIKGFRQKRFALLVALYGNEKVSERILMKATGHRPEQVPTFRKLVTNTNNQLAENHEVNGGMWTIRSRSPGKMPEYWLQKDE